MEFSTGRQIADFVTMLNVEALTNVKETPIEAEAKAIGHSENQSLGKEFNIGRNDQCPCGSGKKFKKCGMLNTEEHQKLMVQK